jgi:hypothetical protein
VRNWSGPVPSAHLAGERGRTAFGNSLGSGGEPVAAMRAAWRRIPCRESLHMPDKTEASNAFTRMGEFLISLPCERKLRVVRRLSLQMA